MEKEIPASRKDFTSPQVRTALVTLTYLAGGFHINAEGYKRFLAIQCNVSRRGKCGWSKLVVDVALLSSLIFHRVRECTEKSETKPHHTVYTNTSKRGWELEGLLFGSCKFIPIICLQLSPVCTVCLQSGTINVIVRGCSCLKCLSYFSLSGF